MSDFSFELLIEGSDSGGGALGALATSEDGGVIVAGVDGGTGAVNVFTGDFSTYSRLTASDAASGDRFGAAVACSMDAAVVVSGAWYSTHGGNTRAGAGYVYSGSNYGTETKLTASDAGYNGFLGRAAACSSDGSVVVLGANKAVYVYSGLDWGTETKLTAIGSGDFFGYSVACSADGSIVVVGAYDTSPDGVGAAGAVYVYSGANWATQTILTASDKTGGSLLGLAVACSGDGGTVVGTAPGVAAVGSYVPGAIYIFSGSGYADEDKLTIAQSGFNSCNTLTCSSDVESIYTTLDTGAVTYPYRVIRFSGGEQLTGSPDYSNPGNFARDFLLSARDGTVVYATGGGRAQGEISAAYFAAEGEGWGLLL